MLSRTSTALALATAAATLVLLAVPIAMASTVDFEGLTTGVTVNGQAGWTLEDWFGIDAVGNGKPSPFDEAVVDDGGNTVWRYSNAVGYSEYGFQPFSQVSPLPAGETGSALWNDRGVNNVAPLTPPLPGTPVGSTLFHAGFRFRSATGAPQAPLFFSISPSAKQSTQRNGYIGIDDDGANGLDVSFYETGVTADPFGATANNPEIASDLSYGDWHTIDIYIEFVDGLNPDTTGNDIVIVAVDGAFAYEGTTWESYYRSGNFSSLGAGDLPHRQAVDSLLFRNTVNQPGNAGGGLFFDDVVIDNAASPFPSGSAVPSTSEWGLVALAALFLAGITAAWAGLRKGRGGPAPV